MLSIPGSLRASLLARFESSREPPRDREHSAKQMWSCGHSIAESGYTRLRVRHSVETLVTLLRRPYQPQGGVALRCPVRTLLHQLALLDVPVALGLVNESGGTQGCGVVDLQEFDLA